MLTRTRTRTRTRSSAVPVLARLRKPECWAPYAQALCGTRVRQAARRCVRCKTAALSVAVSFSILF
ncbi:hypothetical protein [Marinobacterium jannaschii]|uniref:hypothetical protein n=1 Tax=Marinobacterium jannaschii TaxID=64970 RepID=UPI0014716B61|nr:hypothetical protein [Marinobacterium jannaschii]